MRLPCPHFAEHSLQEAHAPQVQYFGSLPHWRPPGHGAASSASKGSHALPPCLAYCVTWRKRRRSPSHLEQAPQSSHSPNAQSTGSGPSHTALLHCLASLSAPPHGWPPLAAGTAISRTRECSPPPQVTVQASHADQSPSWQSTGGSVCTSHGPGPSPGTGLQDVTSFRCPSQKAPLPDPYRSMRRERLIIPWHVCEQALQTPQSLNMQSTSGSHETSALQTAVSLESPSRGSPHALAVRATCRVRQVVPPPQEAEHPAQAVQSAQRPSSQAGSSHECVLQARTSALSRTLHISPPFVGIFAMCRLRLCWPPLQDEEQALQASHSPHSQSSLAQAGCSQRPASESWRLQPVPSRPRDWSTARLLCRCAVPQVAEQ
mmetsp:Transcript_98485/g.287279  ORF Transcript_98485/g.287279 Transcript_98485/m.287279 type:complete len:375 (-) Transcript_98485:2490-3614(-)